MDDGPGRSSLSGSVGFRIKPEEVGGEGYRSTVEGMASIPGEGGAATGPGLAGAALRGGILEG